MNVHLKLLGALASAALVLAAPTVAHADLGSVTCDSRAVPVQVLLPYAVAGTYCQPAAGSPKALVVLVHGSTYNREYWDFGHRPDTYSVSRALGRAGYASLAIDMLGSGASSRPLSALLTTTAQAGAIHQTIGYLRATGFDGAAFDDILLAGHSLGSITAIVEAATFHDVDGVAITGLTHGVDADYALYLANLRPAFLDPAFAGLGLDPGYLTTRPGTRYAVFHAPGQVEPGVIDRDEATKDVTAATTLPDGGVLGAIAPYSAMIDAPVLVAMGERDQLLCGPPVSTDCSSPEALLAHERPYYAGAPCVDAIVMPGVGHDINLHPTAPAYQAQLVDWADAVLGGECPNGS